MREDAKADIERQRVEAEARARHADEIHDEIVRQQEDENEKRFGPPADEDVLILDNPLPEPEPGKPRKIRKRYVQRGNRFLQARNAKLRIGERVYVKNSNGNLE